MVAFNKDCGKIAVANEGEGVYGATGLVDPEGSVSIISLDNDGLSGTVQTVGFASIATSDEDLKAKGVHLPLELKAQEYYDLHSAKFSGDLDFAASRAAYTPATQLEPEYVKWSADGSKIYANCQENSAIVTIDVATATATAIHAMPLKDWSTAGGTDGIDTVKDDACVLQHKPGFKTMRMPDAVTVMQIDGTDYILSANEGDDKEYGDFESKQKFKDVLDSATEFDNDFSEFTCAPGACTDAAANFEGTKMSITIGSSAVDYSNTSAPLFKGAVGFGGRGVSIWTASNLSLVWDSGSMFEKEQCAAYPWAHNTVADEEFASIREVQGDGTVTVGTLFAAEKAGQVNTTAAPYAQHANQNGRFLNGHESATSERLSRGRAALHAHRSQLAAGSVYSACHMAGQHRPLFASPQVRGDTGWLDRLAGNPVGDQRPFRGRLLARHQRDSGPWL